MAVKEAKIGISAVAGLDVSTSVKCPQMSEKFGKMFLPLWAEFRRGREKLILRLAQEGEGTIPPINPTFEVLDDFAISIDGDVIEIAKGELLKWGADWPVRGGGPPYQEIAGTTYRGRSDIKLAIEEAVEAKRLRLLSPEEVLDLEQRSSVRGNPY